MDCPDPRALAEFYCQVLGMRINEDMDGWVVIGSGPGLRQLAFRRCRLDSAALARPGLPAANASGHSRERRRPGRTGIARSRRDPCPR